MVVCIIVYAGPLVCAGVRLDRVRGGRQKYRRSGDYLPLGITSNYSLLTADFAGPTPVILSLYLNIIVHHKTFNMSCVSVKICCQSVP